MPSHVTSAAAAACAFDANPMPLSLPLLHISPSSPVFSSIPISSPKFNVLTVLSWFRNVLLVLLLLLLFFLRVVPAVCFHSPSRSSLPPILPTALTFCARHAPSSRIYSPACALRRETRVQHVHLLAEHAAAVRPALALPVALHRSSPRLSGPCASSRLAAFLFRSFEPFCQNCRTYADRFCFCPSEPRLPPHSAIIRPSQPLFLWLADSPPAVCLADARAPLLREDVL